MKRVGILLFISAMTFVIAGCTKAEGLKKENAFPYTHEQGVSYVYGMKQFGPNWNYKIVDQIDYTYNKFVQYQTETQESKYGGIKETNVQYVDSTGLYSEETMEYTEEEYIKNISPKKTNLSLKFPIKKGEIWVNKGELGDIMVSVLDNDATIKLPIGTRNHLVVTEEIESTGVKKKTWYDKNYGVVKWEIYDEKGNMTRQSVLKKINHEG